MNLTTEKNILTIMMCMTLIAFVIGCSDSSKKVKDKEDEVITETEKED